MEDAFINLLMLEAFEEEDERIERRIFRTRNDPFNLSDRRFKSLFRLSKTLAKSLINELAEVIPEASRASALTVETKVLATLRFFGGGPYQSSVAEDSNTSMERSSVSRSIDEVTDAIYNHLFHRCVVLSLTPNAVATSRQRFYEKFGFPGVVGVIDGTHIAIVAPPKNHQTYIERDYFNYKRYHSINVQMVCDAEMRITNINSRYPGATNDAFIFANSGLKLSLMALHQRQRSNVWLLGDSGYPLEPWLLTPVPGDVVPNSPEERYNRRFLQCRSIVERCIGLLKSRWRCLLKHRVLHYLPNKASKIVCACAVLHNMCIDANDVLGDEELVPMHELGIDHDPLPAPNMGHRNGRAVRDSVIRAHFS